MGKRNLNKVKHVNLDKIENPSFLQGFSYSELDVLAADIRKKIIETVSNKGGHLSSNLCAVELTLALHRMFDFKKDKLIFDVGHQCYTHKLLTGRDLTRLGDENGVLGFQKMSESIYDCYEAGHSSTSISAANGFAIARDMKGENYDIVAFCGDGSIVSGLAFEGLNNLARSNHKVIIILNDNGMSISKPIGGLAKAFANISTSKGYIRAKGGYAKIMHSTKLGDSLYNATAQFKNWIKRVLTKGNIFTELGFSYIGPIDGHNVKEIEKALRRAKNTKKSVVIHACTLKGKGYPFAEKDETGAWHGVDPFDIETGEPKNKHDGQVTWTYVFKDITEKELEIHDNSVVISPAMIKGVDFDALDKKFANRVIDVGIAEEHAATLAGALSLNNIHPIVSIYSSFMQRAYDEISHDIARMNLNATFLVDRAGFIGSSGETHQGIYDEGFIGTIPNTVVTMPSNLDEAKLLYDESFNKHGAFFIRVPRKYAPRPTEFKKINLEFGKWMILKDDNPDLVVIGVGPLLRELEKKINELDIKCTLINALYINPIDKNTLDGILNAKKIVIYDPYSTRLGLVNYVMAYLLEKGYKGSISAHYIPNEFVKAGTIDQQIKRYNLAVEDIVKDLK